MFYFTFHFIFLVPKKFRKKGKLGGHGTLEFVFKFSFSLHHRIFAHEIYLAVGCIRSIYSTTSIYLYLISSFFFFFFFSLNQNFLLKSVPFFLPFASFQASFHSPFSFVNALFFCRLPFFSTAPSAAS